MGELVSRDKMSKQLINGVGGVGGGAAILLIGSWFSSNPVFFGIAAGILGVIGIGMALSKSQKKAGGVLIGTGAVMGLGLLFNWLLWFAGLGLIGLGVYSIIQFFINLKKRS